VRWGRGWLYIYLLFEFQSSINRWMAVRIQTYLGLLYQNLIRTRQLSKAGLLPSVLPIVLYNGADLWNAAETPGDLIESAPSILHEYRPQQAHFLIDEQSVAEQGNLPQRNLSAALFRLEASRTPAEVLTILHALVEWLEAPEQVGLRRAFTVWLDRVFLPKRLPGVELEPMTDLHEVRNMLPNCVESWTDQWKCEGLEQGLKQRRSTGKRGSVSDERSARRDGRRTSVGRRRLWPSPDFLHPKSDGPHFGFRKKWRRSGPPGDTPPAHLPSPSPLRPRDCCASRAILDGDIRSPAAGGSR